MKMLAGLVHEGLATAIVGESVKAGGKAVGIAGDLTRDEIAGRIASEDEGRKVGDPFQDLLVAGRLVSVDLPTAAGNASRFVLTENLPRYLSAFGLSLATDNSTGWSAASRSRHVPCGRKESSR